MALVSAPVGLSGVFEFYLCPEEGNEKQEECLIRCVAGLGLPDVL